MPVKQRKICVMGYRSVGKSTLTIQYVDGQFVDSYDPTIENTFDKPVKFNGQDYMLKIVDTAGQDEYSIFSNVYAMDIHGFVIVYGLNNPKSFQVCRVIHEKLLDMTGQLQPPVVLVGNKADLNQERLIDENEIITMAENMQVPHLEVTAKAKREVEAVFTTLLALMEKQEVKAKNDSQLPHGIQGSKSSDMKAIKFLPTPTIITSGTNSLDPNKSQRNDKKCLIN